MSDEATEIIADGGERGHERWPVIAAIVMLACVAAALVWNQVAMRTGEGGESVTRAQVDVSIRMWYALRGFGHPSQSARLRSQIVDGIVNELKKNPRDVGLWIRLDVVRAEAGMGLQPPSSTHPRPKGRATTSRNLIASLYTPSDSQRDWQREAAALTHGLDLGVTATILRAKAAERSGNAAQAKRLRDRLSSDGMAMVFTLVGLAVLGVLLALTGIIILIAHLAYTLPEASASRSPDPVHLPAARLMYVFALYVFLMVAVGWGLRLLLGDRLISALRTAPGAGLAIQLAIEGAIGAVGIAIARKHLLRVGLSLASIGCRTDPVGANTVRGVVGWMASIPLIGIAAVMSVILFRHVAVTTPPNPIADALAGAAGPLQLILIVLLACVAAPILEETFFRGALYGAMRSRWGVWAGILGSSVVFALMHPQLPVGFLPIFTIGVVLAYLREWTGSLLPGMIVHALNNGAALLVAGTMFR